MKNAQNQESLRCLHMNVASENDSMNVHKYKWFCFYLWDHCNYLDSTSSQCLLIQSRQWVDGIIAGMNFDGLTIVRTTNLRFSPLLSLLGVQMQGAKVKQNYSRKKITVQITVNPLSDIEKLHNIITQL